MDPFVNGYQLVSINTLCTCLYVHQNNFALKYPIYFLNSPVKVFFFITCNVEFVKSLRYFL